MPTRKTETLPDGEPPVWTPSPATGAGASGEAAETDEDSQVAGSTGGGSRRPGAVTVLLAVIALAATAGVAYAAGRAGATGSSTSDPIGAGGNPPAQIAADPSFQPGQLPFGGDRDGLGFRGGAGLITGTVTAVGENSLTIAQADGQTVTIAISSATTYHTRQTASSADVTVGSSVSVAVGQGANGQAGSEVRTATDITVTPR